MKYLTREKIDPVNLLNPAGDFREGASVLFLGMVRRSSEGKEVLFLEYEAYEEMAERLIVELRDASLKRWQLEGIKILHRLGRVDLGEVAVAIEVRSEHREEAYEASRFLIQAVKHAVPIWKKEYFADGTSEWKLCGASEIRHAVADSK